MKRIPLQTNYMLAFVITGPAASIPVIMDKPSWAGGDGDKHGQKNKHKNREVIQLAS